MSGIHVSTTINGDAVEYVCDVEETLLDVLRDKLGMTGSKEGCASGDCGACSVTVDGRLTCSCLMLGAEAQGHEIGMSQIIVSNIALVACVLLFFVSKNWFWLLAVGLLLVSLPATIYLLMPINFAFIDATDPNLAANAPVMLRNWGTYQIIRTIADGMAFLAMCKAVIWPKQSIRLAGGRIS